MCKCNILKHLLISAFPQNVNFTRFHLCIVGVYMTVSGRSRLVYSGALPDS